MAGLTSTPYPVCTDPPHHWMVGEPFTAESCPFCEKGVAALCPHSGAAPQRCRKCNQSWNARGLEETPTGYGMWTNNTRRRKEADA